MTDSSRAFGMTGFIVVANCIRPDEIGTQMTRIGLINTDKLQTRLLRFADFLDAAARAGLRPVCRIAKSLDISSESLEFQHTKEFV